MKHTSPSGSSTVGAGLNFGTFIKLAWFYAVTFAKSDPTAGVCPTPSNLKIEC